MIKTKKIKTCKGWKLLLSKNRQSISNWVNDNEYSIKYPPKRKVVPKLKDSKLFFFKSKKLALAFKSKCTGAPLIMVPCIATNPIKIEFVAEMKFMKDYWDRWINKKEVTVQYLPSPKGTYCADSITCLE